MKEDDPERELLAYAARILGMRALSEAGLRTRLLRRQPDRETVEKVIDKLKALHYLNDSGYAAVYARVRVQDRLHGKRRILHELREQGVESGVAREATEKAFSEQNEDETLRRAAERWLRLHAGPLDETRQRRLLGYLLRQGFASGACFSLLSELKRRNPQTDED